ncbi:pyridoxamine 5'-phosphate oxidase family protein [Pseudoduganella sp. UC29_106]|uniref:pyridoxamine 5'-phosphate oxidase family protein n=1 Tax=Pseudoduganella sp. UC29_106 TaxID=3374553 RepID=UPI003756D412
MTPFTTEELNDLRDKVKDVKYGMFTTADDMRALTSRPLTLQELDDEGNMWFFVSDEEQFTRELLNNPLVNVSFTDVDDHLYVSVSGYAELMRDPAKAEELWNPMVQAWFPHGLDDPHLALLKFTIDTAEYWDTGSSKMVTLLAMAKAALTGQPPRNIGEHHRMGL